MNSAFNSALKTSGSIRKDLSSLGSPGASSAAPTNLTPGALGSINASITSFSRSIDEYDALAKQELNSDKQQKAFARITQFKKELSEYRAQFNSLKAAREDAAHTENRSELLGRRSFTTSTPENPYANVSSSSGSGSGYGYGHVRNQSAGERGQAGQQLSFGSNDMTREQAALREESFFANTGNALDEYLHRGQAILGDLSTQRDMLKSTQRKLYSAGTTLGISGDTIRMIERRAREDKWIFWAGVIVFFLFCWLVLHFLR